jgi:hypothetical protein
MYDMQENKNKNRGHEGEKQDPPAKPERKIPGKPDHNPDPTKPKPGGNEPEKNDPTRIEEPQKIDPTRIDEPAPPKPDTPPNPEPSKKLLIPVGNYPLIISPPLG